MSYHILYVTETRCEAAALAGELNFAVQAAVAKVARSEAGLLPKPYRYLVLTTSETLAANCDLLRVIRAGVEPPRFPKIRLAKERFFDVLIDSTEALTRLIRRLKAAVA